MPRPSRVYHHTFTHAEVDRPVVILALGQTPCAAKNQAWGYLAQLAKIDGLPDNGWRLVKQEDQQILVGG